MCISARRLPWWRKKVPLPGAMAIPWHQLDGFVSGTQKQQLDYKHETNSILKQLYSFNTLNKTIRRNLHDASMEYILHTLITCKRVVLKINVQWVKIVRLRFKILWVVYDSLKSIITYSSYYGSWRVRISCFWTHNVRSNFLIARASIKRSNLPFLFLWSKLNAVLGSTLYPHSIRCLAIQDAERRFFTLSGNSDVHLFSISHVCMWSECVKCIHFIGKHQLGLKSNEKIAKNLNTTMWGRE